MKDKIREIYKNIVQNSDEMKFQRERLEKQIETLLEKERKEMDITEYERYRDQYYEITLLAEESGFILGFQYAMQLIAECGSGVGFAKILVFREAKMEKVGI
ncbi:MAG: hypothetical protein HFG86_08400 [Dorea sp.]|jgi:hypothetical protein|nr:hypothetical protein [Dorea sp.]